MTDYYDWNKTLSYDADVTMVVGARGIGKTYGLRLQFIRDYINNGLRFMDLTRYKSQLPDFTNTYFQRIDENGEFDKVFKTTSRAAYIADPLTRKQKNKDEKPKWQQFGYFGALTMAQEMKKWTFSNVRRIALDEAIIDRRIDKHHQYLSNEYATLVNVIDSVSRERPETPYAERPRIYLLGNAADLLNPYFIHYKINDLLLDGYSWHKNKTMLLHYVKDSGYAIEKNLNTVAGRMLDDTLDGLIAAGNEFLSESKEFVFEKPKNAKFSFGLIYLGKKFGVWIDWNEGYYYVTRKIPKNASVIFSLTASDNTVNYIAAKKAEKSLKDFIELYYAGILRYESIAVKTEFFEILKLFGVR